MKYKRKFYRETIRPAMRKAKKARLSTKIVQKMSTIEWGEWDGWVANDNTLRYMIKN